MREPGLDEMLDARAEVRRLKKKVQQSRQAFNEARSELSAASDRLENAITEIEQQQGRLFDSDEEGKSARRRERKGDAAQAAG